jgi:hypothetical protein
MPRLRTLAAAVIFSGALCGPNTAAAYSVLAHEASVDALWDEAIVPMLRARFPSTSREALERARAYAYGGSVIQDLGYYPFGSRFFSDLLHYVRSGDFVQALVREASDVNDYAFALGALAHHAADNTGHPLAVNRAVPLVFPKLRAKYGDTIPYALGRKQHVMVEFSFDVAQVVAGTYLKEAYRSLVEFQVATPVLERAFRQTYGLEMREVFQNTDLAIGSYRYAVSQIVPAITMAAWRDRREALEKRTPGVDEAQFVFAYPRADYERVFGVDYRKPGLFARFLAFVYRLVPKIGPLAPLSYTAPTPEVEALFQDSLRQTRDHLRKELEAVRTGGSAPVNTDFDTGRPSAYGEYPLADETYARLLERLEQRGFAGVPAPLVERVTAFFGTHGPADGSRKSRKRWEAVQRRLRGLQQQASVNPR